MTSFEQAVAAIGEIKSQEELKTINRYLIERMRWLHRQAAVNYSVGDQVEFTNSRGNREQGQVTKVNAKTVVVKTLLSNWTVSAGMLYRVA
jgi:hypothetical protein